MAFGNSTTTVDIPFPIAFTIAFTIGRGYRVVRIIELQLHFGHRRISLPLHHNHTSTNNSRIRVYRRIYLRNLGFCVKDRQDSTRSVFLGLRPPLQLQYPGLL